MSRIERVTDTFRRRYRREPEAVVRAPGRVNLLGEHVDYNEGFVLPVAIDRSVYVAAGRRDDGLLAIHAADFDEDALSRLSDTGSRTNAAGGKLPAWALYPTGVAHVLASRGIAVSALDAVIASDLPRGAGLSSSAALEVAFARAWRQLGDFALADLELALVCVEAERDFVGVACGVMDQIASACGREGAVLCLDCRSLAYTTIALPPSVGLVVADTGVPRALAASAYNVRRAECSQAVARLASAMPGVRSLRDVSSEDLAFHAALLPPVVLQRARHVVEECERVRRAVECLEAGRLEELGALMNACHESLRLLYEVSCPELDEMAGAAQRIPGCYGARLTGAGFGGSVVALVSSEALERGFSERLAETYEAATGRHASVFAVA